MNKYLSLLTMTLVMVFASCSESDLTDEDIQERLFQTTHSESVVTTPFVTFTESYDRSYVDVANSSMYCQARLVDEHNQGASITLDPELNAANNKASFSFICLREDVKYTYEPFVSVNNVEKWTGKKHNFTVKINPDTFIETGDCKVNVNNATASCRFMVPENLRQYYYFYIAYSKYPIEKLATHADSCLKVELDADGKASVEIKNLEHGAKYYYRAFMYEKYGYNDSNYFYMGKEKSFTTDDLEFKFSFDGTPTMNDSISSDSVSIDFVFSIEPKNFKDSINVSYGICYSTTNQEPTLEDECSEGTGDMTEIHAKIKQPQDDTTYYYRMYLKYIYSDDRYTVRYSDVKTYKTPAVDNEEKLP